MKKRTKIKTAAAAAACLISAALLITATAAEEDIGEPQAEEIFTAADEALENELIKGYAGIEEIAEHVCKRVSDDGIEYYMHYYPAQNIMPATCMEDGYIDRVCEACGEHELTVIPAYGHYMENGACIQCGYTDAASEAEPVNENTESGE